jgi:hypothetical protein
MKPMSAPAVNASLREHGLAHIALGRAGQPEPRHHLALAQRVARY